MIFSSDLPFALDGAAWVIVKVTVMLAVGLICVAAMPRASAAARHVVLAASVIGVVLLTAGAPLVRWLGIELPVGAPPAHPSASLSVPNDAESFDARQADSRPPADVRRGAVRVEPRTPRVSSTRSRSPGNIVVVVWLAGTALTLAWFLVGHARLARVMRAARPLAPTEVSSAVAQAFARARRPVLLESARITSPFTVGILKPVIVLPEAWREWPQSTRQHAVVHELAHVARGDWFVQQLGMLACALYWFHPAVWQALRLLRAEAERACDDVVLGAASGPDYATSLVRVAAPGTLPFSGAAATAMARTSTLEQRVRAILDSRVRRSALSPRRRRVAVTLATAATLPLAALSQTAWSIDPHPIVVIGEDSNDTTQLFARVVGATRLPSGNLLVGDYAEYSLHEFTAAGRHVRSFGRRGQGPGEFGYLARFMRCGDSVVTWDISGDRGSVFALDGRYVRGFRFGSPQLASTPYTTRCNASMVFAHHGWEPSGSARLGRFRVNVPFWLSGADSSVRVRLGDFPGSERLGSGEGNRLRGTRPLPFGKEPAIALGSDRVYIGTGERFEIRVFDLAGNPLQPIVKPDASPEQVSRADINDMKSKEIASRPAMWHAGIERDYGALPQPLYFPAYRDLRVDSEGLLWVENYPRARLASTTWSVFNRSGTHVATLTLPRDLEVFEIGRDYVLGRYLDADEAIPQVRMYRLNRR